MRFTLTTLFKITFHTLIQWSITFHIALITFYYPSYVIYSARKADFLAYFAQVQEPRTVTGI